MLQVKYQQNQDAMRLVAIGSPLIGQYDDMSKPSFATSMMSEMWVLAHRCLLTTCRSRLLFVTRISLQVGLLVKRNLKLKLCIICIY